MKKFKGKFVPDSREPEKIDTDKCRMVQACDNVVDDCGGTACRNCIFNDLALFLEWEAAGGYGAEDQP